MHGNLLLSCHVSLKLRKAVVFSLAQCNYLVSFRNMISWKQKQTSNSRKIWLVQWHLPCPLPKEVSICCISACSKAGKLYLPVLGHWVKLIFSWFFFRWTRKVCCHISRHSKMIGAVMLSFYFFQLGTKIIKYHPPK